MTRRELARLEARVTAIALAAERLGAVFAGVVLVWALIVLFT